MLSHKNVDPLKQFSYIIFVSGMIYGMYMYHDLRGIAHESPEQNVLLSWWGFYDTFIMWECKRRKLFNIS